MADTLIQSDLRSLITGTVHLEAELAASQRNMKELYNITRNLSGTHQQNNKPIIDKNGQLDRWVEHQEPLRRCPPAEKPHIPKTRTLLKIKCDRPTKTKIKAAIKQLKAAGPDNIPPEALKADINTSTDMLYSLFGMIWEDEKTHRMPGVRVILSPFRKL